MSDARVFWPAVANLYGENGPSPFGLPITQANGIDLESVRSAWIKLPKRFAAWQGWGLGGASNARLILRVRPDRFVTVGADGDQSAGPEPPPGACRPREMPDVKGSQVGAGWGGCTPKEPGLWWPTEEAGTI